MPVICERGYFCKYRGNGSPPFKTRRGAVEWWIKKKANDPGGIALFPYVFYAQIEVDTDTKKLLSMKEIKRYK